MKGARELGIRDVAGGAALTVKVVPGASRDRVVGTLGKALKITTSAAAEKGKANKAVAKVLAECLGLSSKDVSLIAGATRPRKEFRIAGMTADRLRATLEKL